MTSPSETEESSMKLRKHKTSKSAATNAMLLSVSFYVIFTTLPATLVYVLQTAFPEGSACSPDLTTDPEWQRYVNYIIVRKVVDEICLSHYACNFFLFVITGVEFRMELCRTLSGRSSGAAVAVGAGRSTHNNGDTECNCRGVNKHSVKSPDDLQTYITKI